MTTNSFLSLVKEMAREERADKEAGRSPAKINAAFAIKLFAEMSGRIDDLLDIANRQDNRIKWLEKAVFSARVSVESVSV